MRPYFVELIYKNNEEVLAARVCYTATNQVFNAQTLVEVASEFGTRLQSGFNGGQLPDSFEILALRVRTPSVGSLGGPSYFENQLFDLKGMAGGDTLDQLFAKCRLQGNRSNGKPVRGGIQLSCVPNTAVDCNVLTGIFIGALEAQLNIWFPQSLTVNEEQLTLSIESRPKEGEVEYVPASAWDVSGQIGTRIDRVLDRKYRKKSEEEAEPPEQPV